MADEEQFENQEEGAFGYHADGQHWVLDPKDDLTTVEALRIAQMMNMMIGGMVLSVLAGISPSAMVKQWKLQRHFRPVSAPQPAAPPEPSPIIIPP